MIIAQKINKQFLEYLKKNNISKISIKNYCSDLSHFTNWILISARSWGASPDNLSEAIPFLNKDVANNYKENLLKSGLSRKTINRRLATLRHFGRFLSISEILDYNFCESLGNVQKNQTSSLIDPDLINDFKKHLIKENTSKNTIKGYLSDVNQFLSWFENQKSLKT